MLTRSHAGSRVELKYDHPNPHAPLSALPFVVGVLGDFGMRRNDAAREFMDVDRDMVDSLFQTRDGVAARGSQPTRAASWSGLRHLLSRTSHDLIKIRVLDISMEDLRQEMDAALGESVLSRALEGAFASAEPFAVLVGDYQFTNEPRDVMLLERLAGVAARANTVFISAAAPGLLGLNSFRDLAEVRDVTKMPLADVEFARWRALRESEDSRYVALCLPPMLLSPNAGVVGAPPEEGLWVNPAYALAGCITVAFEKYGLPVQIRGVEGGGLVNGLRGHQRVATAPDRLECTAPTEIYIGDRDQYAISARLGFAVLVPLHSGSTEASASTAAFFSVPSCHKPRRYDRDDVNAMAAIAAQLPSVLVLSRFAHYLRVVWDEWCAEFNNVKEGEDRLNIWVSQYVLLCDNPPAELIARYPLREAAIEVIGRSSGAYQATAYLKPWSLEVPMALRVFVDLPPLDRATDSAKGSRNGADL